MNWANVALGICALANVGCLIIDICIDDWSTATFNGVVAIYCVYVLVRRIRNG